MNVTYLTVSMLLAKLLETFHELPRFKERFIYIQSGAKVSSPAFASIGNTMLLAGFGVSGNRTKKILNIKLEFFFKTILCAIGLRTTTC